MIHLLFYVFVIFYYLQIIFVDNFNPIGKEFASAVLLGLLAATKEKAKQL